MSADSAKIAAAGALKPAAEAVTAAIRKAHARTGVGFDLLYRIAKRESALDPTAKAATSSAAGLFQFIEQTWLGAVKSYGARHGLAAAAADIERRADGRLDVADPARRAEILNLRFDPDAAAGLAAELVRENRAALEARLGRPVDAGELYAAHFLGPAGAAKLLAAAPETPAADLLPAAAAANRPVFFDGARARSAGEVRAAIARSMGVEDAAPGAPAPERKSAEFAAIHVPGAPALDATWRPPLARPSEAVAALSGPRSDGIDEASATRSLKALFALREPSGPPTLSALAIAVLQALDPTRLASRRADAGMDSAAR